jgi:hypothetical protein
MIRTFTSVKRNLNFREHFPQFYDGLVSYSYSRRAVHHWWIKQANGELFYFAGTSFKTIPVSVAIQMFLSSMAEIMTRCAVAR